MEDERSFTNIPIFNVHISKFARAAPIAKIQVYGQLSSLLALVLCQRGRLFLIKVEYFLTPCFYYVCVFMRSIDE